MTLTADITAEALVILCNITAYVREGGMTYAEGEELKKRVLADTADALCLPTIREVMAKYA